MNENSSIPCWAFEKIKIMEFSWQWILVFNVNEFWCLMSHIMVFNDKWQMDLLHTFSLAPSFCEFKRPKRLSILTLFTYTRVNVSLNITIKLLWVILSLGTSYHFIKQSKMYPKNTPAVRLYVHKAKCIYKHRKNFISETALLINKINIPGQGIPRPLDRYVHWYDALCYLLEGSRRIYRLESCETHEAT